MALTPRLNRYIAHTPFPKQSVFLLLDCLEALYGGAAGPGKSDALLMAALQYVDLPGYAALLLRKSYADLSKPKALMDRAREWLAPTDAAWNGETHTWRFPSGAQLAFGYLDHDGTELQYQSSELQFIGWDELTQFKEAPYRYMFSRLRRIEGVPIPLRMRAATNPGGPGHEWVKQRFITGRRTDRVFVPALFTDNPYIDQEQYRLALAELDPVRKKQLEDGDWDVTPEGAIAQRQWFKIVDAVPAGVRRVRFWDKAATEASAKSKDPDWTVGTKVARAGATYYIEHVVRSRVDASQVMPLIGSTGRADGPDVHVYWEQEGGGDGKIVSSALAPVLAGLTFRPILVHKDKVSRAMPFLSQARAGNVFLVRGGWNEAWLDEICAFPQGAHDDQMDSASGGFTALTSLGWARGPAGR